MTLLLKTKCDSFTIIIIENNFEQKGVKNITFEKSIRSSKGVKFKAWEVWQNWIYKIFCPHLEVVFFLKASINL